MVEEEDLEVVVDGVPHKDPVPDHLRHLRLDLHELRRPHQVFRPHPRHSRAVIRDLKIMR